jgi:Mn-dependent DtxR family transcriptional regulator
MDKERIDEALELLWVLNEDGHEDLNRYRLSSEDDEVDALINTLKADGLATISGNNILFTEKGRAMARALIRRLRLAYCYCRCLQDGTYSQ